MVRECGSELLLIYRCTRPRNHDGFCQEEGFTPTWSLSDYVLFQNVCSEAVQSAQGGDI